MTPEVQRHVFEPFFTTAAVGEGAGLGLSAVQGLVALNGGFLTYESAPMEGTRFTLWFPAVVTEQ
jgi:signal transduction histidine kinase